MSQCPRCKSSDPKFRGLVKTGDGFCHNVFHAEVFQEATCKCSVIAGQTVPNPECPVHVEVAGVAPSSSPERRHVDTCSFKGENAPCKCPTVAGAAGPGEREARYVIVAEGEGA